MQQLDQLGGQLRTVQDSVARVAAAAESAGVMEIERRIQVEAAGSRSPQCLYPYEGLHLRRPQPHHGQLEAQLREE